MRVSLQLYTALTIILEVNEQNTCCKYLIAYVYNFFVGLKLYGLAILKFIYLCYCDLFIFVCSLPKIYWSNEKLLFKRICFVTFF